MNLPSLIFAEAAVKSSRAGYVSIFDPKAEVTPGSLKKFYADPEKITEAVTAFKTAGFSILKIGRISIGIAASPEVFQNTFGVALTAVADGKNSLDQPKFFFQPELIEPEMIDLSKISDPKARDHGTALKALLCGVVLLQPVELATPSKIPPAFVHLPHVPPNALRPDEIPEALGDEVGRPTDIDGSNTEMHIIDTGFYQHPYFDDFAKKIEKPIVNATAVAAYNIRRKDMKDEKEELQDQVKRLMKQDANDPAIQAKIQANARAQKDLIDEDDLISKLSDPYDDEVGHGTLVLANALHIAPGARFHLYKALAGAPPSAKNAPQNSPTVKWDILNQYCSWTLDWLLEELAGWSARFRAFTTNSSRIVSCSFGSTKHPSTIVNFMHLMREKIAQQNDLIILFAAGNHYTDETYIEVQWGSVITVGGAYFEHTVLNSEGKPTLTASNFTHGYENERPFNRGVDKLMIPDICGLCGPIGYRYLLLPTQPNSQLETNPSLHVEEGWIACEGGASSATPQVAAVCALITQAYKGAKTPVVKAILQETGTPLAAGAWATPTGMRVNPILNNPGARLANITLAVQTALELAALVQAKEHKGKEPVSLVTTAKQNVLKRRIP